MGRNDQGAYLKAISNKQNYLKTQGTVQRSSESPVTRGMREKSGHSFFRGNIAQRNPRDAGPAGFHGSC